MPKARRKRPDKHVREKLKAMARGEHGPIPLHELQRNPYLRAKVAEQHANKPIRAWHADE